MALSDVIVEIDIQKSSGLLGFGTPLILTSGASEKYAEYINIEAVAKDYNGLADGASEEVKKVYNMAKAIFEQEHAPSKIVIASYSSDGEATEYLEEIYDKDFYFILSTLTEADDLVALATKVEELGRKVLCIQVADDVSLGKISAEKYTRTICCYHATEGEYMDCALIGECGSQAVGSITWKFKNLKGITPADYTLAELETVHTAGAIAYVTKAGDNQTSEGIVVSGEYIDIIHSKDYVQFNIEYKVQKLFNNTGKVPYTNVGIALIENEVINVLQSAYNNGIVAEGEDGSPLYSTTFPKRSEVPQEDREGRKYNVGTFTFELAGAVHSAEIKGSITM